MVDHPGSVQTRLGSQPASITPVAVAPSPFRATNVTDVALATATPRPVSEPPQSRNVPSNEPDTTGVVVPVRRIVTLNVGLVGRSGSTNRANIWLPGQSE